MSSLLLRLCLALVLFLPTTFAHIHNPNNTPSRPSVNTGQPQSPLPCCPATCPLCLHGSRKRKHRPAYVDQRGAEYAEPQVVRRRPGRMLQKAGELLRSKKSSDLDGGTSAASRYTYEKGRVRPVVEFDEAELYLGPQWQPLPVCVEDSDCPCYNCQCCYTETVMCTVEDLCEATLIDTTTVFSTVRSTKTFKSTVSIIASIIFTVTNTLEFRSTETTVATEPPVTSTFFNVTTEVSNDVVYIRTVTKIDLTLTPVETVTVSGGETLTIQRDVISIVDVATTLFGGSYTIPTAYTLGLTESIPSYVPFTIWGRARTASTTFEDVWHVSVTLRPVTEYYTPMITVSTASATATRTSLVTATKKACDNGEVETVRITPTKTVLRSFGTVMPSPVTCCDGRNNKERACPGCPCCG